MKSLLKQYGITIKAIESVIRKEQKERRFALPKHYNDYLSVLEQYLEDDPKERPFIFSKTAMIKKELMAAHQKTGNEDYGEIWWETLKFEAPELFDSFLLYMERKRAPQDRFYQPRRKTLKPIADAIQDLADDKLDEIFINLPPRTGKTQLVKLAMLWWGSRDPEASNLYSAYSDRITRPFYDGLIELIKDPTYTYAEIFPKNNRLYPRGDDETLDIGRKKTYHTFTARSLYGTLNGSCDCSGLAIADDLFSGIEEAINLERQEKAWKTFSNNFMTRLKGGTAKLINMGTRWAIGDVQGRRLKLLQENPAYKNRRWRAIIIPALDEKDESNFDYDYKVGFSTEAFKMIRAGFEEFEDMASWQAQYQQQPVERLGSLFEPATFAQMFSPRDLPEDVKPDRVFMAVDVAFGGGDYVSAPICLQFDKDYYICDVVYNKGDKYVTQPLIAQKIMAWGVQAVDFEETKTTSSYRERIEDMLATKKYECNILGHSAKGALGKNARIFDKAPEIRELHFLLPQFRHKEYKEFMANLFSFTMQGRNEHDDAPDSLAQLCDMKMENKFGGIRAARNPFMLGEYDYEYNYY